MSSCCDSGNTTKKRIDWLFWGGLIVTLVSVLMYWLQMDLFATFTSTMVEFLLLVWWGLLLGIFFVGLLNIVPKEATTGILGKPGKKKSVLRAALAGLLFDLCSHGILLVGLKFYERGASLGQVMAFLIASPWNSFSLTFILIALIGLKWTLVFIGLSFVIAVLSGLLFDHLVEKGVLPKNKNQDDLKEDSNVWSVIKNETDWSFSSIIGGFKKSFGECQMIIRWMFVGIIGIGLVRSFMDLHMFQEWFAPTVAGLFTTLVAATIIEVCSEGLAPIASDLLTRAKAPGNAFTFLMAGVSTDYTEIMGLKEVTKSWKIALYLPLVTVPQILLAGYLMNGM